MKEIQSTCSRSLHSSLPIAIASIFSEFLVALAKSSKMFQKQLKEKEKDGKLDVYHFITFNKEKTQHW